MKDTLKRILTDPDTNLPITKPMQPLNDEDLDWLTAVENRLIRMRKREDATNDRRLSTDITDTIERVDWLRQMLGARLGRGRNGQAPG